LAIPPEVTPVNETVCVLLATYGRPRLCARSLVSLLAAAERAPDVEIEILVGVNGPDAETVEMIEGLRRADRRGLIRPVVFDQRLTPSTCRNRLLRSARGEWIYFVDDDAYVSEDFFSIWAVSPLRRDFDAIGGPNLNPPRSNAFQEAASRALASPFATYFSSARYVADRAAGPCSEESVILCNLFVRRQRLTDEPFLGELVCAEENWMLQDLERAGARIGYDPDLAVWHERRPDLPTFLRQVFKYGFGRGQIFRRRPSGLRWAHVLPTLCLLYTAAILLLMPDGDGAWIWYSPYIVYAGICLWFARRCGFRAALLFPLIHAGYGGGLIWGVVRG
jgi:glycosyltransferase involved in cell wall biosynthesis